MLVFPVMFKYFTVRITLLPFVVSLFTVILNANTWQGTDTYMYIKQLQPKPPLEDYHSPHFPEESLTTS